MNKCIVDCSAKNLPPVKVTEGTESIGRFVERKFQTQDYPNYICKPCTDLVQDDHTDSENEDSMAYQNVIRDNQQMGKSPEKRQLTAS